MSSEHFSAHSNSILLTSDHVLPFTDIVQHVRTQEQLVRSQETPLLSHASDPMYHSMKMTIVRRAIWLAVKDQNSIHYNLTCSWHKVIVMRFPQISHAATYQQRGASGRSDFNQIDFDWFLELFWRNDWFWCYFLFKKSLKIPNR